MKTRPSKFKVHISGDFCAVNPSFKVSACQQWAMHSYHIYAHAMIHIMPHQSIFFSNPINQYT